MTSGVLCVRGLCKRFGGAQAVQDLSFDVGPGEIVGLLGPNGAGKTTTLKTILGLLRPTSGSAQVLGIDVERAPDAVKRHVGYMPDEPAFYDFLTGNEVLSFVTRVRGLEEAAVQRELGPLVERLSFASELAVETGAYSLGMRKKLALLVALAHAPKLLLLDEPTNGLDPPSASSVRHLLEDVAARGTSVIVSTHLLDMADRLCGRALVLHQGRLLADASPLALRERVGLPATALLEEAFLLWVRPG